MAKNSLKRTKTMNELMEVLTTNELITAMLNIEKEETKELIDVMIEND